MELLKERQKTHGDYEDHARVTQGIKRQFYSVADSEGMTDSQRETVDMIAHKLGRIAAGDPNHIDHWEDIAGYATLIVQQLREENKW